jgi:hypothetical protein
MELAALFDLIPVSDRLHRVEAFTAAAAAILAVLKGSTNALPAPDQ